MNKVWKRMPSGRNVILDLDGWYLSYNRNTTSMPFPFMYGDEGEGKEETAICVGNSFYILNGDHRQPYEALCDEGIDACLQYFLEHEDQWSSWSNKPPLKAERKRLAA